MRITELITALEALRDRLGDVYVENAEGILVEVSEGRDERGEPIITIE